MSAPKLTAQQQATRAMLVDAGRFGVTRQQFSDEGIHNPAQRIKELKEIHGDDIRTIRTGKLARYVRYSHAAHPPVEVASDPPAAGDPGGTHSPDSRLPSGQAGAVESDGPGDARLFPLPSRHDTVESEAA